MSKYIERLKERTRTASARLHMCQSAYDNYRRCNPNVDWNADPVGVHLNKQAKEASAEFARLYDELKSLTWGKQKSLADSIKITQD